MVISESTTYYRNVDTYLRVLARWCAKALKKKLTPLARLASLFHNQAIFQKFGQSFFDQVAIDVPTFGRRPLVAELKFKASENEQFVMFLISALPPEGTFQMSVHLSSSI